MQVLGRSKWLCSRATAEECRAGPQSAELQCCHVTIVEGMSSLLVCKPSATSLGLCLDVQDSLGSLAGSDLGIPTVPKTPSKMAYSQQLLGF